VVTVGETSTSTPKVMVMLRYGMTARNLLRTGFLATLLDAKTRPIVVCPAANEQYFRDEMEPRGVELVPNPEISKGLFERLWRVVTTSLAFQHPGTTSTTWVRWLHDGLVERDYGTFLSRALGGLFQMHRSPRLRRWLERFEASHFFNPEIGRLFDEFQPDIYVATYTNEPDTNYIREARVRGIPTVAIVKSWDNLSNRGPIEVLPDRLLVWSEEMRREAIELHHVDPDRITVVGAPQYDVYANFQPRWSREEFMARIGAEPGEKLVVYSPGDSWTFSDRDNLHLIHDIFTSDDFPGPVHLHVRKYPKVQNDLSDVTEELGMTLEGSGRIVKAWADRVDQNYEEMRYLAELMHHADLLIHFASTIGLDACAQDTPNIGFDLDRKSGKLSWPDRGRRMYRTTHNRLLVEMGCMRVVTTPKQLREAMTLYIEHPETDRSERKAILDQVIGHMDGRAGERIALEVMGMLR
jgi:hypothetical protein